MIWLKTNFFATLLLFIIFSSNSCNHCHDGDKNWFNPDDTYDIEKVYAGYTKNSGALLLCKALPLDKALTKNVNPRSLFKINYQYARLVLDELDYLNQPEVHQRVVKKMMACLENKPSKCQHLRVNYQLCAHNLYIISN